MKLYAVIDTNVLVSSLLSVRENSPVVLVWDSILNSDSDDRVFFEIMLSCSDAYLITGNKKHFPQFERVISLLQKRFISYNSKNLIMSFLMSHKSRTYRDIFLQTISIISLKKAPKSSICLSTSCSLLNSSALLKLNHIAPSSSYGPL